MGEFKMTLHGWVLRTDCDEIDISKRVIGSAPIQIMPDGTGFKGEDRNGEARKGDLKVVIGITPPAEKSFRWEVEREPVGMRLTNRGKNRIGICNAMYQDGRRKGGQADSGGLERSYICRWLKYGRITGKSVWILSAASSSALEITNVFHKIGDNSFWD